MASHCKVALKHIRVVLLYQGRQLDAKIICKERVRHQKQQQWFVTLTIFDSVFKLLEIRIKLKPNVVAPLVEGEAIVEFAVEQGLCQQGAVGCQRRGQARKVGVVWGKLVSVEAMQELLLDSWVHLVDVVAVVAFFVAEVGVELTHFERVVVAERRLEVAIELAFLEPEYFSSLRFGHLEHAAFCLVAN